jgi:hypothetical protein
MFGLAQIIKMNGGRVTADQATELAAKANDQIESIGSLLKRCREVIVAESVKGKTRIPSPLIGLRMIISDSQRQRVKEALVADGFTIWQNGDISWGHSPAPRPKASAPKGRTKKVGGK